jgi:hypothetical protein
VFNRADFTISLRRVNVVIKPLATAPSRRRTTPMISLVRLARLQDLKETFGEDPPLATRKPPTSATETQHDDHRNAWDGKVLQKTPVLAMAEARSRKCTKVN